MSTKFHIHLAGDYNDEKRTFTIISEKHRPFIKLKNKCYNIEGGPQLKRGKEIQCTTNEDDEYANYLRNLITQRLRGFNPKRNPDDWLKEIGLSNDRNKITLNTIHSISNLQELADKLDGNDTFRKFKFSRGGRKTRRRKIRKNTKKTQQRKTRSLGKRKNLDP